MILLSSQQYKEPCYANKWYRNFVVPVRKRKYLGRYYLFSENYVGMNRWIQMANALSLTYHFIDKNFKLPLSPCSSFLGSRNSQCMRALSPQESWCRKFQTDFCIPPFQVVDRHFVSGLGCVCTLISSGNRQQLHKTGSSLDTVKRNEKKYSRSLLIWLLTRCQNGR